MIIMIIILGRAYLQERANVFPKHLYNLEVCQAVEAAHAPAHEDQDEDEGAEAEAGRDEEHAQGCSDRAYQHQAVDGNSGERTTQTCGR